MKKSLSVLLSVLLLVLLAVPAFAVPNGKLTPGAAVTAADARQILRAAVGLETLSDRDAESADLDLDGKVTAADARTALRAAVGLEILSSSYFQNAYDALQSGHFYAVMPMDDGGASGEIVMAFTDRSTYLKASLDKDGVSMTLPILRADGKTYFLDEDNALFAEVTDEDRETFRSVGMDLDEMFDELVLFDDMPALSTADAVREVSYRGQPATQYVFAQAPGEMRVYLSGRQLLGITEIDSHGNVVADEPFSAFSISVPLSLTGVPAGFSSVPADELFLILMTKSGR